MGVFILLGLACCGASAQQRAELPPGVKRVLFLGDSITHGSHYVCDVEAYFVMRYPERKIEFINEGLPSETVSGLSEPGHAGGQFPRPDLHERLARVLAGTKPDLVFACYGMNDGIYLPLDDGRFGRFKEGMTWMHEQVTAAGAKIVHVTPPTYDAVRGHNQTYNAVLDAYSDWLLSQRDKGWDVVDVHGPMNRYLESHRKTDPAYFLSGDGVHPNELGHWLMAKQILLHLGAADVEKDEDVAAMVAVHPHGAEILKLIEKEQSIMKEAWLTSTGHKRPMKPGLPLPEAEAKTADIDKQIHELALSRQ